MEAVDEGLQDLMRRTEAAIKIQKVWRGAIARKHYALRKQGEHLRKQADRDVEMEMEQDHFDHMMPPKPAPAPTLPTDDPLLNDSAVRIQSTYRMHRAKKRVIFIKEDRVRQHNAVKIQKVFRGALVRQEMKKKESMREFEQREARRRMLIEKFKDEQDARDTLVAVNGALQKRLAEYFHAKKTDEKREEEANSALSGDLDARYNRYLGQFKELNAEHQRLQAEYAQLAGEMEARLADRRSKCKEFRDSFLQFRREVCSSSENSRTGKPMSGNIVSQYEETIDAKDVEVGRARLKNISYRNRLAAIEEQLKAKEELAEGLHLIDFEQLKIENQTLNEKIEERNEELAKLQRKTTTTVHILTHVKEKLQFVQSENQRLKRELAELEEKVTTARDAISRAKLARDSIKTTNTNLRAAMPLVGNDDLLIDYEMRKDRIIKLRQQIEELRSQYDDMHQKAMESTRQLNTLRETQKRTLQARQALTGVPYVK